MLNVILWLLSFVVLAWQQCSRSGLHAAPNGNRWGDSRFCARNNRGRCGYDEASKDWRGRGFEWRDWEGASELKASVFTTGAVFSFQAHSTTIAALTNKRWLLIDLAKHADHSLGVNTSSWIWGQFNECLILLYIYILFSSLEDEGNSDYVWTNSLEVLHWNWNENIVQNWQMLSFVHKVHVWHCCLPLLQCKKNQTSFLPDCIWCKTGSNNKPKQQNHEPFRGQCFKSTQQIA